MTPPSDSDNVVNLERLQLQDPQRRATRNVYLTPGVNIYPSPRCNKSAHCTSISVLPELRISEGTSESSAHKDLVLDICPTLVIVLKYSRRNGRGVVTVM